MPEDMAIFVKKDVDIVKEILKDSLNVTQILATAGVTAKMDILVNVVTNHAKIVYQIQSQNHVKN
jgi:hypothetical protein